MVVCELSDISKGGGRLKFQERNDSTSCDFFHTSPGPTAASKPKTGLDRGPQASLRSTAGSELVVWRMEETI